MRHELEANGRRLVWDTVEIEGGAHLIRVEMIIHRKKLAYGTPPVSKASQKRVKRPRLSQEEYYALCEQEAEREGRQAWQKRVPRNGSRYKNRHGRVFDGMRPEHDAWLRGWKAAEAEYLIASGGRPRPPRKEKKAASA